MRISISTGILLLILLLSGCIYDSEDTKSIIHIGDPLPPFSVIMENGTTVNTSNLHGEISLIVFFNTSCPDCRKELPVIEQLYREQSDLNVVCIAREENSQQIREYWETNSLTLPFSPQSDRRIFNLFAQAGIPRIYISDAELIVRYVYDDKDMPTLQQLLSDIDSLK